MLTEKAAIEGQLRAKTEVKQMPGKLKDYTGRRFGMVNVLEYDCVKANHSYWIVRCDCGRVYSTRLDELMSGRSVSCGCYAKKKIAMESTRHGEARTKLYHVYYGILQRCDNPKHKAYGYYGGRGIKMCEEWANDYTAFSKWAHENGYREGLSIDRIDVNGGYEPGNCRWATVKEQTRNTRRNTMITHDGVTMCLKDWCIKYGVNCATACSRRKAGKSFEEVFGLCKV